MPNPRAQKNANLRSTATGIYDAVTQGLLPMLGNAARGSVAATLGAPGDILGLLSDKQPLPTSQNILDYIPAVGKDKNVIGMGETMGGFVPTPGSSGLARAAKTALNPMTYGRAFMETQAPAVMSPITAFHGTPHKFDKFSMDKIGTGEGAQAYGHGLYFADNPRVAKDYQEQLSRGYSMPIFTSDAAKKEYDDVVNYADYAGGFFRNTIDDAKGNTDEVIKRLLSQASDKTVRPHFRDAYQKLADLVSSGKVQIPQETPGSFYKVDIPDEAVANMLLWDKPLSEQPEAVRKATQRIQQEKGVGAAKGATAAKLKAFFEGEPMRFGEQATGQDLYRALADYGENANEGSEYLKQIGIPGIRYFDGLSRGSGQGTMNTVVFDDSLIKILERNGVPMNGLLD